MKFHTVTCVFLFLLFPIYCMFPKYAQAQVKVNEFVVDPNPEWVELSNASPSAEYIRSFYIDDDLDFNSDSGSSDKRLLTDLNIDNPSYPHVALNSFLNNSGDYVVLFDSLGNIVDSYQYTSEIGFGVSMGRSPDGNGNFFILTSPTKGAANSAIQNTPTPFPTASPTSTPTQPPTNPPTSVPTSTPIKTTVKPMVITTPEQVIDDVVASTVEANSEANIAVLGVQDTSLPTVSPSPHVEAEDQKTDKIKLASIVIFAAGSLLILLAIVSFVRTRKVVYNDSHEENT